LDNIPVQARKGLETVLAQSFSVKNRETKRRRLGFSTSEDAVTWVVFSYLAVHAPAGLSGFARRLLGLSNVDNPELLLWGVPVPPNRAGADLQTRLVAVLTKIEGTPRSEPDVVLNYGQAGLVIIEVKLHAPNDVVKLTEADKLDKYLANTFAFANALEVKNSRMYELARNWRIGWDLAGRCPFRLVNLGTGKLFKQTEQLDSFEKGLAISPGHSFRRLTWTSLLQSLASDLEDFPGWLEEWLKERGLKFS
jgi:hypothetical protein